MLIFQDEGDALLAAGVGGGAELVVDGGAVSGDIVEPPEVEAADLIGLELLGQGDAGARTSSCLLKSVVAVKESALRCGLKWESGAPGQSTLNSGLAMSVTRRLYFARMARARARSSEARSVMFLPHRVRSSTHCRPKSLAATEQAWSKSSEISLVITLSLKGEFIWAKARSGTDRAAVAQADVARNSRRVVIPILFPASKASACWFIASGETVPLTIRIL